MSILGSLIKGGRSTLKFIGNKKNLEIGIKGFQIGLDVVGVVSELAGITKEEKSVVNMINKFAEEIKENGIADEQDIDRIARTITNISEGNLKDVALECKNGKINGSIGTVAIQYDIHTGRFTRVKPLKTREQQILTP